jgi:hypothetical protein
MDRRRKVSDQAIRQIFVSKEPASVLGRRFHISEQMVYLIRSRRAHAAITHALHRNTAGAKKPPVLTKADVAALADAIIERLVKRLAGRDPKPKRASAATHGHTAKSGSRAAA